MAQSPVSAQGGWNPERWLALVKQCSETILKDAPDRYGSVQTPMWIGIIDPKTNGLLDQKPPNWQRDWDAEDYVLTAQGCNLYRDMPTLKAFYDVSGMANDARFKDAADAYLKYFLENMPSKTTGLFPWGEHMSYNTVRDRIVQTRHEMERNLPDWEMLWSINPQAVQREIEAIRRINIYDDETYVFDRHANYYTGEYDPLPVRGAYIKHSGLFTYSFMFLYSKTHDPQHLEWTRKMSDAYWRYRNPETQLIPGYVSAHGGATDSTVQMALADCFLRALEFYRDPVVEERALKMVDSFLKYGFDKGKGVFAYSLDPATGKVTKEGPTLWAVGESADSYRLLACLDAYSLTHDAKYLEPLRPVVECFAKTPYSEQVPDESIATWLEVLLKAYRETHDAYYLREARRLADWSAEKMVRDGLILESADGYVYQAKARPGLLMQQWLDLYRVEQQERLHWTAPDSVAPGETLTIRATAPSTGLRLVWRFRDGVEGSVEPSIAGSEYAFAIPIPAQAAQGPLELRFSGTDASELGTGTLLVTRDATGPTFADLELPKWSQRAQALSGKVRVADPVGVVDVKCVYSAGSGGEGSVDCSSASDGVYTFTVPPANGVSDLRLRIVARGNPDWPVESVSDEQSVALSDHAGVGVSGEAGVSATVPVEGWDLQVFYEPFCQISDAYIQLDRLNANPAGDSELPSRLLSPFYVAKPDNLVCAGTQVKLIHAYKPDAALEVLDSTLAAYEWKDGKWRKVLVQSVDRDAHTVTFLATNGGTFVVGGEPRGLWRRTFSGALLNSPAAARISPDGRLAIIVNTGASDGILYAVDAEGKTLWTYDPDSAQPFPTVADLDGDGFDEIAVGGRSLTVLGPDGAIRWRTDTGPVGSPVVGDIDGDGVLDVAACSQDGTVTAYTREGKMLWQVESLLGKPALPALAKLGGTGLALICGGTEAAYAVSSNGTLLWKTPVLGQCLNGCAAADLNGDGLDESIFVSRTDEKAEMTAVAPDGKVLWTVPVTRESDWSPMVADLDPSPGPEVVAMHTDRVQLALYSPEGKLVRTIPLESRTTMTPVPMDLDGKDGLDLLLACNESRRIWAIANDGTPLWTYTPASINLPGAKVKLGGSLLIADMNGDGKLEVVGGDDETWLNAVRTDLPCKPYEVVNGQYHGDPRHSGYYVK
jgi:hypothetical protein